MPSIIDPLKIPKVLLIVLDGFGDGKNYPFNAIQNSKMPFYKSLRNKFPRAQLLTCGESVGLPQGVMGNSEVGHMNMGAGRIVYQELSRINKSIREQELHQNATLLSAIEKTKSAGGRMHLMGLFSDAGVHSTIDHLKALIEIIHPHLSCVLHLFTDGRDTPPTSALQYAKEFTEFLQKYPNVSIGSVSGRYYAMDRDNRWDRVEKAFHAITGKLPAYSRSLTQLIEESYQKQVTDEFIVPTFLKKALTDNDGILFYNFRADRARELTKAFTNPKFSEFKITPKIKLSSYTCMTEYDKTFGLPVLFSPQNLTQILPDILKANSLSQFRIAETEKYAHVTFFFNGGRENPYDAESRILIPSPKDVPTYDLKPEMSAFDVTNKLTEQLSLAQNHFALVNFANPDMVGHTGNYEAALKALECVDQCLEKTISTALRAGYEVLMTADHGNIEEMRDEHDQPHTQHTLNPVPLHFVSNNFKYQVGDGVLADLAPTILEVMGLPQPKEMTGKSLLKGPRL